uniref:Uncharacterized protein n=1 Tax=Spironucleus salmonicida TaxID=348837 RepID=V6LRU6_9EUKA|eukprot:EST46983.1 Hypothetical protein SS50377_12935 [Spironucleus salmonicida]
MNRRTLEPLSAIHAAPAAVSRSHHLRDLLPRSATPKQGRCQPTSTLCEAESAHGPKTMETLLRTPPPRVGGPAGAPLSAAGPAASFTLGNTRAIFIKQIIQMLSYLHQSQQTMMAYYTQLQFSKKLHYGQIIHFMPILYFLNKHYILQINSVNQRTNYNIKKLIAYQKYLQKTLYQKIIFLYIVKLISKIDQFCDKLYQIMIRKYIRNIKPLKD